MQPPPEHPSRAPESGLPAGPKNDEAVTKNDKVQKNKGEWDETIKTVLVAILVALVFRSLLFEPFHIPSGSMKSNLLVGDYLFVSKYSYGYSRYSFPLGLAPIQGRVLEGSPPKRGDVVVFRLPANTSIDYIKRIVGLPGDTIQVRQSILYINGQPLPRERVDTFTDDEMQPPIEIPGFTETLPEGKQIHILQQRTEGMANNTGIYRVPEGHYFMMGDNRDNSTDSRFADGGVNYVPARNIIGRAELILFSTDGSAKWWQVWKWPGSLRTDRFFRSIH